MKPENYNKVICIIAQHSKIVIHSWLIPDELASYMVPGF